MRYRRLSYRYGMAVRWGPTWSGGGFWQSERFRLLVPAQWQPDADAYETARTIEIVVDLAGLDEEDFEVQMFEDALVVEGHRQLPSRHEEAVYHAAGIRHGPFRLEVPLPASVDAEQVRADYDRGLLRITLPKREEVG